MLFLALDPSDLTNPLVGVLSGLAPHKWKSMSSHACAKHVAKNPASAAQFFDIMIKSFLDIVVHPGKAKGLFGQCTTYYAWWRHKDKVRRTVICCYGLRAIQTLKSCMTE